MVRARRTLVQRPLYSPLSEQQVDIFHCICTFELSMQLSQMNEHIFNAPAFLFFFFYPSALSALLLQKKKNIWNDIIHYKRFRLSDSLWKYWNFFFFFSKHNFIQSNSLSSASSNITSEQSQEAYNLGSNYTLCMFIFEKENKLKPKGTAGSVFLHPLSGMKAMPLTSLKPLHNSISTREFPKHYCCFPTSLCSRTTDDT